MLQPQVKRSRDENMSFRTKGARAGTILIHSITKGLSHAFQLAPRDNHPQPTASQEQAATLLGAT
jgi:hypothetical protein